MWKALVNELSSPTLIYTYNDSALKLDEVPSKHINRVDHSDEPPQVILVPQPPNTLDCLRLRRERLESVSGDMVPIVVYL